MKNKLFWYRQLYLGNRARKKDIWNCLTDGKVHPRLFLLAFPANPDNVLDIFPQSELFLIRNRKESLYIVGAAWGKMEAMELAGSIAAEAYRITGSAKVKQYLGDDFLSVPEPETGKLYEDWE